MDQFYSLLCNCWKGDGAEDSVDIIFNLPPEMAIIILRLLDPRSLVAAVLVCKKWFRLIRSDRVLRKTVREELIRQREARMNLFYGVETAPAPRRSRPEGSAARSAFVRKYTNRVAHGNSVPGSVHPSRPTSVRPATVPVQAPRPRQFGGYAPCEVFTVPTQAPQLSVPRQTYNVSSGLGFDARRIRTVNPVQSQPEPTHSLRAPQLEAPTRKASKYRPSRKIVDSCKARPTSLRL